MEFTKPVPLPRQRAATTGGQKPVPLPRKFANKPSLGKDNMVVVTEDVKVGEENGDGDVDLDSIPDAPSFQVQSAKRGTINIFQLANQMDDPFNDFDADFNPDRDKEEIKMIHREVEKEEEEMSSLVLSQISFPSPLRDLDEETRRRISTFSSISSTSTDDSDHYMEPPPARPVSAELASNLSGGLACPSLSTALGLSRLSGININRGSRTGSGRNLTLPPLHDGDEGEDEVPVVKLQHHHHPLDKVASCPPAPLAHEDEEYEPIASPGTGYVSGRLPSSPGFPSNNNFHANKRATVPNVNVNLNVNLNTNHGEFEDTKGLGRFAQNKLKFENSITSVLGDLTRSTGSRHSIASDTESTDSFQFSNSNSNNEIKRSSSYRSSTGSLRRIHEYDDVAIEDGTVVFLDNMENAASLSDETNNNSSNSLTSRNSVVAEFDPLLFSFRGPTPPVPPTHSSNIVSNGTGNEEESEPLNLNDGEQHRYEYIDTDAEDSRSSCSNSNNEDPPPNSNQMQPQETASSHSFAVDFKANFRKLPHPEDEKQQRTDIGNEEYEQVDPPLPPPKSSKLSTDQTTQPQSQSSNGTPEPSVNSFFRRFSSKFRLNSIREENPACRKCGQEHGDKERCKFSPAYRESVVFSTNLYKAGGLGRKEWTQRRVVLQPRSAGKGRLSFYNDKAEIVSELPLEKVVVISKKESNSSSSSSSQLNLQYFELGLVHWKQNTLVLAAVDEAERDRWMGKYVEAQTTSIPLMIRSSFDRGGWVFLKETVATSEWRPGWLLLKERSLVYAYQDGDEYWEMDLRKARSIELSGKEEEQRCSFVDNGEVLTIDLCSRMLYIQTESSRVSRDWEKALRSSAARNGPHFEEMQLTQENVPVVVDKCIDFLYAHGTLAEGIYRQSGSNTRIAQLLSDFQKDAWAVTIAPKEFSAHDVAGTLKRFFRTLPEPLVTTELYPAWIKAAGIGNQAAKEAEYIRLLECLPPLNYNILRKLMCHLYAVHELHEKNLMPLINLAPIWGPTLMSVDGGGSGLSYDSACAECEVVKELIEGYYTLFQVEEVERARERRMHLALENFHLGSLRRKCSGDMKIWIYLWDKDEASACNVALTPYSTAAGIVTQILENSRVRNAENVGLHEVICGETLERVLHPMEKVIDTVLRWSLWDIEDRKDNFLILKKNMLYPRLLQYAKEPHMLGCEVKVADSKSKSYRKAQLHFSQATLKLFKDVKCNVEQACWKIEDIVWYVGCESRRSPPTKWSFTLAPKTYHLKRSKEEPFFGWVVCAGSEEELHRWLGALVVGEHPEGLYPSVML